MATALSCVSGIVKTESQNKFTAEIELKMRITGEGNSFDSFFPAVVSGARCAEALDRAKKEGKTEEEVINIMSQNDDCKQCKGSLEKLITLCITSQKLEEKAIEGSEASRK